MRAFENVTRQTLMADIVPRQNLGNAVALTRTGRDATQIVSPIIGGLLLDSFGLGWAYVVIIVLLFGGTALTLPVKPPPRIPMARGASIFTTLAESFRFARSHEVILALLLLAFIGNLTGFPLNQGLVPVFAYDVLLTDSTGLGWLLGAYSAGAFLGSIVIAGIGNMERSGRAMALGSIAWHAGVAVLAGSKLFGVSLGVLAFAGLAQSFHDGYDVHHAADQHAGTHSWAHVGTALARRVRAAVGPACFRRDCRHAGHHLRADRQRRHRNCHYCYNCANTQRDLARIMAHRV